jgi:hypothetical protein
VQRTWLAVLVLSLPILSTLLLIIAVLPNFIQLLPHLQKQSADNHSIGY